MDPLTSGTFVGAGSFRCRQCGYTLTLSGAEPLSDCPMCQGRDFVRASLFSTERIATSQDTSHRLPGARGAGVGRNPREGAREHRRGPAST